MTKRLNAEEAIANVLGSDITDVRENCYHYGRTSKPVFSIVIATIVQVMSQQSFTKVITDGIGLRLNNLPIKEMGG